MLEQNNLRLAFCVSNHLKARNYFKKIQANFKNYPPEEADCLVVLGGDGFMLHTLHHFQELNKPFYGINCGTFGFLMNNPKREEIPNLFNLIHAAEKTILNPLVAETLTLSGITTTSLAINEVSFLRKTSQAAKLKIFINGVEQLKEMTGDGLIIATPAGSTAYNSSAHGPILPLEAHLLALTPLNVFRPRRWRGALLPNNVKIDIETLDPHKRKVDLSADSKITKNVHKTRIFQNHSIQYCLLFNAGHKLEERILKEQFFESC